MSLRFLVLHGNSERWEKVAAHFASRLGLSLCLSAGPLQIYISDPTRCISAADGSVVIGTIFEKFGPPYCLDRLDAGLLSMDVDAVPPIIKRYWGNYLALSATAGTFDALRAPFGALPCYYLQGDGATILVSDPLILRALGIWKPGIDWSALGHSLFYRDLPISRTCLEGLEELLPGQLVSFSSTAVRAFRELWSPWDHVNDLDHGSDDDLIDRVRRTITNCIVTQAAGHDRILATLSGGLDSSIVASCLGGGRRTTVALTLTTGEPSGDERSFARQVCDHQGFALREAAYDVADVALGASVSRFSARPVGRIHESAFRASVARAVAETGSSAVMSGNGGDNVFYNSQSARPLADRFILAGLSRGLVKTAADISRLTQSTIPAVTLEALRVCMFERRRYRWRTEAGLLSRDIVSDLDAIAAVHSWLEFPGHATPAKIGHVAMILRMLRHLEGYDRDLPFTVINPLACQPIVELMLAAPAWHFCDAGHNRSIIRKAFRSKLPMEIVNRRTKLGPDFFILDLLDKRSSEIRERLLEGALAAHGIADRDEVEAVLANAEYSKPLNYMRLMAIIDAELWTDSWRT